MSNFDQNDQRVNNQINIANVSNLNCVLWIDARGGDRIFHKLLGTDTNKKKSPEGFAGLVFGFFEYLHNDALLSEPDFLVYVDGQLSDGLNGDERKKFAITPGRHTVEIKLNITENRRSYGGLAWKVLEMQLYSGNSNKISFPVSPGETIELDFKGLKLKFKD